MKTSHHSLTTKTAAHSRPDHADGGRLKDKIEKDELSKAILRAGKNDKGEYIEWSGDFAPQPFLLSLGFSNIPSITGNKGQGFIVAGERTITDYDIWEKWVGDYSKSVGRYHTGKRWETTKALKQLTATIRPDHAVTLHLAGDKATNSSLVHKLGLGCINILNEHYKEIYGPIGVAYVTHLGDSVPHIHPQYQTVAEEKLLWVDKGEGKKAYRCMGPGHVAIYRLTRAGLYVGDEVMDRYIANHILGPYDPSTEKLDRHGNAIPGSGRRDGGKGLGPDAAMSCWIDDVVQAHIDGDAQLKAKYVVVRTAYKKHLDSLVEGSPFNVRAQRKKLENEIADKDVRLAAMEKQVAELVQMMREIANPTKPTALVFSPDVISLVEKRSLKDLEEVIESCPTYLSKAASHAAATRAGEVHFVSSTERLSAMTKAATVERDRWLGYYESGFPALPSATYPINSEVLMTRDDDIRDMVAKPVEAKKPVVVELKVEPAPEPFFAPVVERKQKTKEEQLADLVMELTM